MEKSQQKLTLDVDEEVLTAATKFALDQGSSVEQLVCDYLADFVEESQRHLAGTWSRRDIYKY